MKHVEVVRETSPLSRQVWMFFYLEREHTLRCSHWRNEQRQTARHKFRDVERYDQHRRGSTVVALPDDVRAEAVEQFVAGLTATTWGKP